ncbi:unnamed protein product [Polarella glacialis]|nr:unnamed protein product [Polarella glacialis]
MAGVRAPTRPCNEQGCPVILSLHGMDVPASRQAYAYKPKANAWVLAPHGRSAFAGLNWQNQGHRSAWAALAALKEHSRLFGSGDRPADISRVIFTGHSNGGFGALLLATEQPDLALGVAPLAGMLRLHGPSGSAQSSPRKVQKVQDLLDRSIEPYNLGHVAGNVVGIPCLARTGAEDEVIHPSSTRQLVQAIKQGGGDCSAVEVPGKGHWWWDTETTMDGGAVDDAQMSAFREHCLEQRRPRLPGQFVISCVSLDMCGGRGGLRLLQQMEPFMLSQVLVDVRHESQKDLWEVQTDNLVALGWNSGSAAAESMARGGLVVDGTKFSADDLREANFACRRSGSSNWRLCPSAASCCEQLKRRPEQAGPLRSVFEGPLLAVIGTLGLGARERHLDAAVLLANSLFSVGGGTTSIAFDSDGVIPEGELTTNLLLLGGPESNTWSAELLAKGALPDLRLGPHGQIGIGPCDFQGANMGVVALGPLPGGKRVFAVMSASSTPALARLLGALGRLSERNLWQVRLPDYMVVEDAAGKRGVNGILAAGFWGGASGWDWSASQGYASCVDEHSEL